MSRIPALMAALAITAAAPSFAQAADQNSGADKVAPASGQTVPPEKRKHILALMKITNAAGIGRQIGGLLVRRIDSALHRRDPNIHKKAFQIVKEETEKVLGENIEGDGGLLDMLVPIYARNFSDQDLKDLIKFYQTPLGKKLVKTMPMVMRESMQAGETWGRAMAPVLVQRIQVRLKDAGIDLSNQQKSQAPAKAGDSAKPSGG